MYHVMYSYYHIRSRCVSAALDRLELEPKRSLPGDAMATAWMVLNVHDLVGDEKYCIYTGGCNGIVSLVN